jgi:hypothetical protein
MIPYRGRSIPQTFEEIVDPRHTALVVHELLNDFCAKGGAFDKLGRIIDKPAPTDERRRAYYITMFSQPAESLLAIERRR